MKTGLIFLSIILLAAFAQSEISFDNVSNQANEFFGLSKEVASAEVITSQELSQLKSVQDIAGNIQGDQVCVSLGEFKNNPDWQQSINGQSITYFGVDPQELDFFVICEVGNKLGSAISFFPNNKIKPEYASNCPQINPANKNLACLVVLNKFVSKENSGDNVSIQLFFLYAFVLLIPFLFMFRAKNINLKVFNFIKVVFLIMIFTVFYFISLAISALNIVMLLFFFFVQINLSIAPLILGIADEETSSTKLVMKIILVLEVIGLIASIILISPLL